MEMCYDGTLVMPANYAVVSEDEMTYVDGGVYISHETVVNIVSVLCVTSYEVYSLSVALMQSAAYVAGVLVAALGPVIGGIVSAAVAAYIGNQATNIASAFYNDLVMYQNGIDINKDAFFGATYACFTARQ